MIEEHFPDYENSAFVQEKFHEDWSKDQEWGWQQNRAVVGHNLKIAWNLMRVYHMKAEDKYLHLSEKIAELMPKHGMDPQRGGWYDVVERTLGEGETVHRYAWHDRKAWWQQEQGILAYQILSGSLKKPEYLKYARESAAFYNAWFLDHDSGGIYFNVLSNGLPYLMGNERMKGSHSMSGYHSFELCYLGAVYNNLLIAKHPMDLYFKPKPGAFKDNLLRVAPDLLPEGSIRIASVTIDGQPYHNFDADGLYVTLPDATAPIKVKVTIEPTSGLEHFGATMTVAGNRAILTLSGDLDARALPHFRNELAKGMRSQALVLDMTDLNFLSSEGARALIFTKQKMDLDASVSIVGAHDQPREKLEMDEFTEEVKLVDKLEDL